MALIRKLTKAIKNYTSGFHSVVPFNAGKDILLKIDFTKENKQLTDEMLKNTELFSEYINSKLEKANAKYGIGGYDEHRTIYSRSEIFSPSPTTTIMTMPDGASPPSRWEGGEARESLVEEETISYADPSSEKPKEKKDNSELSSPTGPKDSGLFRRGQGTSRTVHLGIDIWGEADTPVYAPMEGIVHSLNFNNAFGDYGATIILQHTIEDFYFHTLYGHLSLKSIQNLKQGETIEKGQWIGSFGEAEENGHWPPHLHFQIIIDMEGMKGDYTGVCKYSEKEKYLANCPDPDLILDMMQYAS